VSTSPAQDRALESTTTLLARVRAGDPSAREQLCRRFLPLLMRWAHGRLPQYAREGVTETEDLVHNSLVRALNSLERFEPRHEGAFFAYLRRILLNQVKDRIRSARRRARDPLDEEVADMGPSPLERAIGRELLDRYDRALERLPEDHREAVMLRVELGYSYQQVAEAVGSPSANAVRLTITRALVKLARLMHDLR